MERGERREEVMIDFPGERVVQESTLALLFDTYTPGARIQATMQEARSKKQDMVGME